MYNITNWLKYLRGSYKIKTVADLFNQTLSFHGGKYNPSSLNNKESYLFNQICQLSLGKTLSPLDSINNIKKSWPRSKRVYIDYVDNYSANAIACCNNNVYFVGIWIGLSIFILNFFPTIMRHEKIFSDVGNNKKDSLDFEFSMNTLLRLIKIHKKNNPQTLNFVQPPKDETRAYFAVHLGILALEFIIDHELSHIYMGHLDYIRKNSNNYAMLELNSVQIINAEIRQGFELEADGLAARLLMNHHWTRIKGDYNNYFPDLIHNKKHFIRIFTFIYGMIFYLMRQIEVNNLKLTSTSHPPARMRLFNVLKHIESSKIDGSFSTDEMEVGLRDGLRELRKLADIMNASNKLKSDQDFDEMSDNDYDQYINLMRRRNDIKDLEVTKIEI